jgi:chromosome segregation ATPase
MAAKDPVDLQGALRGSVVPLSLKALKKKGVKRVKVIERDRLLKALVQAVEQKIADRPASGQATPETPGEKKRVELLLIELERVSKAKAKLEHDKGLLEAERSRLAADLERVAQEISKNTGQKVKPEEVKNLLDELERVREDRDKTRKSLDRALKEAERRIEAECERARTAEAALAQASSQLEATRAERDAARTEVGALTERASRLEAVEGEAERLAQERDKLSEKNVQMQRELQRYRADYESALRELEAAAPILAAHREAEKAREAEAAEAPPPIAREAAAAKAAAPKAAPKPRIPGFGFGDSVPPSRESRPRNWS